MQFSLSYAALVALIAYATLIDASAAIPSRIQPRSDVANGLKDLPLNPRSSSATFVESIVASNGRGRAARHLLGRPDAHSRDGDGDDDEVVKWAGQSVSDISRRSDLPDVPHPTTLVMDVNRRHGPTGTAAEDATEAAGGPGAFPTSFAFDKPASTVSIPDQSRVPPDGKNPNPTSTKKPNSSSTTTRIRSTAPGNKPASTITRTTTATFTEIETITKTASRVSGSSAATGVETNNGIVTTTVSKTVIETVVETVTASPKA